MLPVTVPSSLGLFQYIQPPKSHYLSKVGRGAGAFALSTGYRSRTANLTSSASSVRNLRMFKMTYSWSVRTTLPCQHTTGDHQQRPQSRACGQRTRLGLCTHPVVQLDDQVISSFVAPKLEVHDPVYAQLFHTDKSPGL